jgi:hypothetical protein
MTDDTTAAMGAGWRKGMDRTLEAIEDVCLTAHSHLETFIVRIATYFTGGSGFA